MRSTLVSALLVCSAALPSSVFIPVVGPAWSQEQDEAAEAGKDKSSSAGGLLAMLPADSETKHVLQTDEGPLPYTATAGTLELRGADGQVSAKIFYTAYRQTDAKPDRPVTFVFNGGPGAASAYLHMGLVGPKILPFSGSNGDGSQPVLQDNRESWLAFTDLVLIDPVGTGWSRAATEDGAKRYFSVRQDAESLAKAISLYVQKNDRLASPKYLLGESYGGFRAAKVAQSLKKSQSLIVSGIVMVSPLMEGRFVFGAGDDPLAAALQFPSLAAAHLERQGQFDPERLALADTFAMTDYLTSLAGPWPEGAAAEAFYQRIADFTGLPKDVVAKTRGFVGEIYAKQAAGAGKILSPYDAGVAVQDAYPEASYGRNDDPILDGYTRAYGAGFAAYARQDLGFKTEMTYSLLNEDVNRRWEWNDGRSGDSRVTASVETDLRDLLSTIPSFRLMVAHGYSDILTAYGASRYVLDHLPPDLARQRTQLKLYRGGHMFYTRDDDRRLMFNDARAFYGQSGTTPLKP
ncbi:S10 family peptidase [Rhizobium sp. SSA_523]|uniref:S10 family peptidase n=1 Tax=Rhizobium sp. SSA_523 TaxID=2952477 RepID=UPI0020903FA3|nr:carboxypeptidase [Rhizobium sp. SSA_523]MCO5733274.1 carboxypeptidase [Rhizobium sp. SSA_523]